MTTLLIIHLLLVEIGKGKKIPLINNEVADLEEAYGLSDGINDPSDLDSDNKNNVDEDSEPKSPNAVRYKCKAT